MNLFTKVAYNTMVQVASKVISAALGLIAIAIMTRYLGKEGFGQYTTIITFISFFGIIADLGLTLVTVQMISQPGVDENKVLSNLFSLRLVSAFIFLGLAPIIVLFLPYEPIIKVGVLVTALSFFFIALNQILVGLFQKKLRLDKVSIAEVISRIVLLIGVVIVWRLDLGLINIMTATVVASAVNFLLHYLFSRSFVRIKLNFDFRYWVKIIKKSWPLALTIIFNLIYLKADTLILSLIKSQAEVGVYGAAYKVIDVLIIFPFVFSGIVLPIMAANWLAGDKLGFKNVLQKSYQLMIIIAVPLIIGTQLLAKDIMVLVAGQEFAQSGAILQVLILAAGLIFFGCIFAHGIIAIDKQRKIIGVYLFTAITALAGYLIFIPRYSYFGAAWVTIYSELVIALASFYLIWKYTKFLPDLIIFLKTLAASAIMAAVIYFMMPANLFLILGLAVIVYFTAIFLLGAINRREIISLVKK